MKKLNDLIELAGQQAELVMIGLGQDLMPSWLLIDDRGKIAILATPWRDDLEKSVARVMLEKMVQENHVVTYSFVSEAWASTKPAGWKPPADYQGVRHEPDRREVVIAYATDGKTQEFRRWAIERDWNEKVCALELMPDDYGDPPALEGWMTELLKGAL